MAGLLSSIGLGFLLNIEYLLPITTLFLILAVGSLLHGAKKRRGYKPFWLGLAGAVTIIVAKFFFHNEMTMYAGLAALAIASFWHAWPRGWLRKVLKGYGHKKV